MTPTLASTWQFFLSEKRKSIQELTFLEGQKIGYKFPYYQPDEQVCIRVIRFICDVIIMNLALSLQLKPRRWAAEVGWKKWMFLGEP